MTAKESLKVKAYRSYDNLSGLKEFIHEQGFNDGWRSLKDLILQKHPELAEEFKELETEIE